MNLLLEKVNGEKSFVEKTDNHISRRNKYKFFLNLFLISNKFIGYYSFFTIFTSLNINLYMINFKKRIHIFTKKNEKIFELILEEFPVLMSSFLFLFINLNLKIKKTTSTFAKKLIKTLFFLSLLKKITKIF